jgi:hypothetical protein
MVASLHTTTALAAAAAAAAPRSTQGRTAHLYAQHAWAQRPLAPLGGAHTPCCRALHTDSRSMA